MLTGRCSPTGQDTPLRPWREALLAAARAGRNAPADLEPFVPALARVVPEWGAAAADASPLVLGEAVRAARVLVGHAGAPPRCSCIEDLHWADPESLAVLEYVADNLAGAPLLVVATAARRRAGARPRPGRRDGGPPGRACAAARRAEPARRCWPSPARASTGTTCRTRPRAALVERCDGVPFLVEELLATAVRSGWDTITDDVPGSVAASVATRLGGPPTRGAAAAHGGRAPRPLLRLDAGGHRRGHDRGRRRRAPPARRAGPAGGCGGGRLPVPSRPHPGRGRRRRRSRPSRPRSPPVRSRPSPRPTPICRASSRRSRARLADAAGQRDRAAGLWLQAAERALDDGSLASAEALATRARDAGRRRAAPRPTGCSSAWPPRRARPSGPPTWARSCWRSAPIPRSGPRCTWCWAPPTSRRAAGTTRRPTPPTPGRWRRPSLPVWPGRMPSRPRRPSGAPSRISPSPSRARPSPVPAPPPSRPSSARPSR